MAQDNELINQEEIERLLQQSQSGARAEPKAKFTSGRPAAETLDQKQIESLLGAAGAGTRPAVQAAVPPPTAGDPDRLLGQNDLEKLLGQAGKAAPPKPVSAKDKPAQAPPPPGQSDVPQDDVEFLLQQAEQALASVDAEADATPPGVAPFRFQELSGAPASSENTTLDLIRDVELDLRIELGRTQMYLEDLLKLRKGSVVPLDKLAGDPVDIYVNGRLIARGEVLVLNDNFCVRVAELIAGASPAA